MSHVLTITPNTLVDFLGSGQVRPGVVNRLGQLRPLAGGKGINVARVLARHGHQVIACGFAGGEVGRMLTDLVTADGVEPAFIQTAARTRLGVQVQPERGPTTAVLESGFPLTSSECGQLLARVRGLLSSTDLVICSGSVPDPIAEQIYRQICDLCAHKQVPCWVDAYGPAMEAALAGAHPPHCAKPNAQEYAGLDSAQWLATRELHISDGPRMLRVLHPEGRFKVRPPAVAEVNPVGSGDCYVAGLAHGRLSGWPIIEQLRYAAAAGAVNAARGAVADLAPADIIAQVSRVEVEPDS